MVNYHPWTTREVLNRFHQLIQEGISDDDMKIGAPDVIVEIDESKFDKVKYHRVHRVEGIWVVEGVERTRKRKCFLITVVNRNSLTMEANIRKFARHGSIVYTDFQRAYNIIPDLGMKLRHGRVNHSVGFVNGEVCTNTVEDNISTVPMELSMLITKEPVLSNPTFTIVKSNSFSTYRH